MNLYPIFHTKVTGIRGQRWDFWNTPKTMYNRVSRLKKK